ncbi:MAG TPA: hypothetical protein VMV69_25235 [Pirellulales bacterium]|nr:hypothetical protein [Pirellulales bacterium]
MPLLDHFHPPLRGPRRWEGFHHSWASNMAQYLNREILPADYFAESEISLGPNLEIDVASFELKNDPAAGPGGSPTAVWAPPAPLLSFPIDFSRLDVCEVRVYEELGGSQLRAAIELVSPANKDRPGSRRTFAAKCAGYLRQAVSVVIIDVVTERNANLHADLLDVLEVAQAAWESPTRLCAISYRPIPMQGEAKVEAWPETLSLGAALPVVPLWLGPDLAFPLNLDESYETTCAGLRIDVHSRRT